MLIVSYQSKISFTQTCTGSMLYFSCTLPRRIFTQGLISHFLVTTDQFRWTEAKAAQNFLLALTYIEHFVRRNIIFVI